MGWRTIALEGAPERNPDPPSRAGRAPKQEPFTRLDVAAAATPGRDAGMDGRAKARTLNEAFAAHEQNTPATGSAAALGMAEHAAAPTTPRRDSAPPH